MVSSKGKIIGEARKYDPFCRFGEIMLYEIDNFGFIPGYISKNWSVMSEQDIYSNRRLTLNLHEAKYQMWKRHNISELKEYYEKEGHEDRNFERFCRKMFRI